MRPNIVLTNISGLDLNLLLSNFDDHGECVTIKRFFAAGGGNKIDVAGLSFVLFQRDKGGECV